MMRRLLVLQLALAFVGFEGTMAFAVHPDIGPGCGLGKIAWQDYKNTDMIGPQLLMSTTNNTILPWQAFGITSGTLGCKNNREWFAEQKVNMFASINLENLSQEMAQGQGEHLASLATLMGVPAEQHPAFFAMTQERYATLIEAGEASPVAMIKALNEAMVSDQVLARATGSR